MAVVPNILSLTVVLLFLNIVKCDVNTITSQQVEDCKNVCRSNFQDRLELKSCIGKCLPVEVTENKGELDNCIKDCVKKTPEGQALCELKCKNVPEKKDVTVSTVVPIDVKEASQIFTNIHSRVSKMMDCLLDGMRHQLDYGWANLPNMMESRMDKFMSDANQFFKDEIPLVSKLGESISANDAVELQKEEGKVNQEPLFKPVMHRLIIIKKFPFFNYDNEEAEQAADLQRVDSMTATFKNFFNSLVGNEKAEAYPEGVAATTETEASKSFALGGESEKKSKFCDFLSSLAHRSGLKRTTFILLMAVILLCFAWYCIATIISSRHKEMYREQQSKVLKGDLEYLVPIEEKFIFFAHLDEKEKPGEVIQAPSIPVKIKIQDV